MDHDDTSRPKPRRGRPLLVAGLGLAATVVAGCSGGGGPPVGNLRPLDCDASPTSGACQHDAGTDATPTDGTAPDAADATTDAATADATTQDTASDADDAGATE